jgi:hypothetical protein
MSKTTTVTLNRIAVLRRRGNHGTPELVTTYETQADANNRIREEQGRRLVDMNYFTVGLSGTYQQPIAPYAQGIAPAPIVEQAPKNQYTVTGDGGVVYGTHDTNTAACAQRDRLVQAAPTQRFTVNVVKVTTQPVHCPPLTRFLVEYDGEVEHTASTRKDAEHWARHYGDERFSDYTITEFVQKG